MPFLVLHFKINWQNVHTEGEKTFQNKIPTILIKHNHRDPTHEQQHDISPISLSCHWWHKSPILGAHVVMIEFLFSQMNDSHASVCYFILLHVPNVVLALFYGKLLFYESFDVCLSVNVVWATGFVNKAFEKAQFQLSFHRLGLKI